MGKAALSEREGEVGFVPCHPVTNQLAELWKEGRYLLGGLTFLSSWNLLEYDQLVPNCLRNKSWTDVSYGSSLGNPIIPPLPEQSSMVYLWLLETL